MKLLMMSGVVALLAVVGCASAGSAGSAGKLSTAERLTLLGGAKVDVVDAIKAALAKTPGRVVDTELHSKHGKTVWEIDIAASDSKVTEVDVDATTGAVTDSE